MIKLVNTQNNNSNSNNKIKIIIINNKIIIILRNDKNIHQKYVLFFKKDIVNMGKNVNLFIKSF